MAIYQTACYTLRSEALPRCLEAIREFVAYVKEQEPGTLQYTALQQADDPTSFWHLFIFADEAARERHATSEAVQRFTKVLYPEALAPIVFTEYTLAATT